MYKIFNNYYGVKDKNFVSLFSC